MVTAPTYPPVRQPSVWNAWMNDVESRLAAITSTGVGAGPYSYLVRKVGSVYEAYSSNASLVYGGTNDEGGAEGEDFSAVIQAIIDALGTDGAIVALASGSGITANTSIVVDKPVNFVGFGAINTAQTTITSTIENDQLFNVTYGDCGFQSLNLAGSGTGDTGILVDTGSAATVKLSSVYLHNFVEGLKLDHVIQSKLEDVFAHACGIGIHILGNSYLNSFLGGYANLCDIGVLIEEASFFNKFDTIDFEINDIGVQLKYYACNNVFDNCWFESSDTLDIDINPEDNGYSVNAQNQFKGGHLGYALTDKGGMKVRLGTGAYHNTIESYFISAEAIGLIANLVSNGVDNKVITRDVIDLDGTQYNIANMFPAADPDKTLSTYYHTGAVGNGLDAFPSGSVHISTDTSGLIEITADATQASMVEGQEYTVVVQGTSTVRLIPIGGAFYFNGAKEGDGDYLYSNTIGSSVTIVLNDADDWVITNLVGTWAIS